MRHYVISDPHSFLKETKAALTAAGYFDDKGEKRLVVVGDVLDRGDEARAMTDFLLSVHERGELVFVLGNHEDLLVRMLHQIARGDIYEIATGSSVHISNGTWDTALQLSGMHKESAYRYPEMLVRRVMESDFYQSLLPLGVDYYETEHYVFTHGYIPVSVEGNPPMVNYSYDENWRCADNARWQRARWYNGIEMCAVYGVRVPNKTVVCGHFHTSYGHCAISGICREWGSDAVFLPFYSDGLIAIDACTSYSGIVNCIVIDDEPLPV